MSKKSWRTLIFVPVVGIIFLSLFACTPQTVEVEKEVTVEVPVEIVKEVKVEVEKEVTVEVLTEIEVTREVEVISEVEVTRIVETETGITSEGESSTNQTLLSEAPVFHPFDAENPTGSSHLIRQMDGLSGGFVASDLTPGDAMTLWFIVFNYPEKCVDGPFQCGPQDLGSNREAQGDFMYVPGAGTVIGLDGTAAFSGSLGLKDTSGSGMSELPNGCVPGYEDCGEPVGILNPMGALVITALHSHGPALSGDDLAYQTSSYLGGCDEVIGTLPGGFSASLDEIPDAPGECATIQISPHTPADGIPVNSPVVSSGPAFFAYDAENPKGHSYLVRSEKGIAGGFASTDLTPDDAMTLWFIIFNYPEKCLDGPFQCGPQDLGSAREAQGDFLYVPGAGGVIGEDGRAVFNGTIELNDQTGSGLLELPGGCVPGYEGCGDPIGLLNPAGALIITALHSHGPALNGDELGYQTSSYLGGCDAVIGTLPGGFAASPDEIPDALGECATLHISPQTP